MSAKEILLEQLKATYDENYWFVCIKNSLADVTAEQARWKPAGTDNSIWETLSHLNYYNNAHLQRFKGIDYEYTKSENSETFSASENDADWQAKLNNFDAIMREWRELLTAADNAKFDSRVSATNDSEWKYVISDINLHNAHHGGQIVLLRKLQGSWDSTKGVS